MRFYYRLEQRNLVFCTHLCNRPLWLVLIVRQAAGIDGQGGNAEFLFDQAGKHIRPGPVQNMAEARIRLVAGIACSEAVVLGKKLLYSNTL